MSTPAERVELAPVDVAAAADPLLLAAFDAAADGLAVVDMGDRALRVLRANARLAELLETDVAVLPGAALADFTDAAGAAVLADLTATLTLAQTSRARELNLRPGTRGQRWVRLTLAALRGPRLAGLALATITDLSDRHAVDVVIATLPFELIVLDRDLRIRWVNPAGARAAGLTVESMTGRDWREFVPGFAERRGIYEQVLAGESLDFEAVPLLGRDGCQRWYQSALRPLRDASGAITGMLAMGRDITDRVTARTAIEQAEKRFAAMIRGSNDLITIIDAAGRIVFVSPSAEHIIGCRPDTMVGRPVFDWVHPGDLALLQERFDAVMAVQGRSDFAPLAFRVRHADGRYVWLETTSTNLSADPVVGGVVAVARDITKRHAAEAALEESRAKLDIALNGAAVGTWQYDVVAGVHSLDARCARILGYHRGESVAEVDDLASMTHPDDIVAAREALVKHLRGDVDWYEAEYRVRDSSGAWRWVAARGRAAARDAEGRVLRLSGVLMDIDARKRAEHTAQIQTDLLENAAADGQLGLWSLNPVTHERTVNDGLCRMTGYSMKEWCGQNDLWLQRMHPDDRTQTIAALRSLIDGNAQALDNDIEHRFLTKAGDWRWFTTRARVVARDASGRTTRIVGRTLDVTARKRVRQLLHETQVAAGVGGWELDVRSGAVSWTDQTYALFDTTRAEFKPSLETTLPLYEQAYHARLRAAIDAAIARGEPFDMVVECQTLKGRRTWSRLIGKAEVVDGRTVRLYGAQQDVTEMRRVDAALKQSEAQLRAMASSAPDWLALLDLDLRILFVNRGLRGLDPSAAIGVSSLSLVPEHLRSVLGSEAARVIAHARPSKFEANLTRASGAEAIFEFHVAPVIEVGRVVGLSVRTTDVTEARLRDSTLRTQARMLEALREGVLLVGPEGVIQIANAAAARMFGASGDALMGTGIARLGLDPHRLAQHAQNGARASGATLEWRAHRFDGREDFIAEAAVVELRDSATAAPQIIAVVMDVTERRLLEAAIISASNREQERIGHDLHDGLGQELTGISLLLRSVAQRAAAEYPSGAALLDEVVGLVNHAVESARALAHGLSPVVLERDDLPAALAQLAASTSRTHGVRVRFRKAIEGPLQIDSTATHHLYRVAQEAVTNAARHGGASAVTIRLDANPRRIRMSISDDGCGLSPAGGGARRGDGMGLRIMEYRARMMHAEFRIVPLRRRGTQVRVTLPPCGGQGAV